MVMMLGGLISVHDRQRLTLRAIAVEVHKGWLRVREGLCVIVWVMVARRRTARTGLLFELWWEACPVDSSKV